MSQNSFKNSKLVLSSDQKIQIEKLSNMGIFFWLKIKLIKSFFRIEGRKYSRFDSKKSKQFKETFFCLSWVLFLHNLIILLIVKILYYFCFKKIFIKNYIFLNIQYPTFCY